MTLPAFTLLLCLITVYDVIKNIVALSIQIYKDGRLMYYLDATDEESSSWMRFIKCARHRNEQNLFAFQYCGNIYYRAFKEIPIGTELLVWYEDIYPQYFGIPISIHDLNSMGESAELRCFFTADAQTVVHVRTPWLLVQFFLSQMLRVLKSITTFWVNSIEK